MSSANSRVLAVLGALAMMGVGFLVHNARASNGDTVSALTAVPSIDPAATDTIPPVPLPSEVPSPRPEPQPVPGGIGSPLPSPAPLPATPPAPLPATPPAPLPATPPAPRPAPVPSQTQVGMQLTVACLVELEDACASVDNVGRSAFSIEPAPSTIRDINNGKGPDAWLTTELEPFLLDSKPRTGYSDPEFVAGTPLRLVHRPEDPPLCSLRAACQNSRFLYEIFYPPEGTGVDVWMAAALYDANPKAPVSVAILSTRIGTTGSPNLDSFRKSTSKYFATTDAELFTLDLDGLTVAATGVTVRYVLLFRSSVPQDQRLQLRAEVAKQLLARGYGEAGTDPTPTSASAQKYWATQGGS